MVHDWNSSEELAKDGLVTLKMMHVLAGLYYWEFVTSLGFEWKFISGKRKFHWPMIFYFGARYSMLSTLTGFLIALNVTTRVNCLALYNAIGMTGQSTAGFTSLILGVRTMVIWKMRWYIVVPLVILSMGQWAVIILGGMFTAHWVPGTGCVFAAAHRPAEIVTFIYSICFDFLTTVLATYKLTHGVVRRSQVANLLFKDGLIYFILAFLANIPAVVMLALYLNPILGPMLNVPASVIYVIVACRAVRHLVNFRSTNPNFLVKENSSLQPISGVGIHPGGQRAQINLPTLSRNPTGGVHVQTDTFQVVDMDTKDDSKGTESLDV